MQAKTKKMEEEPQIVLSELPDLVLCNVVLHLPFPDLLHFALASHRCHDAANDDELVWKLRLCRTLGIPEDGSSVAKNASWKHLLREYTYPLPDRVETPASHMELDGLSARLCGGTLGRDRAFCANRHVPLVNVSDHCTIVWSDPVGGGHVVALSDVFYFEISIANAPLQAEPLPVRGHEDPCVSVGLSTPAFNLKRKQTGWDGDSIGYHGDDGFIYHAGGTGVFQYGPRFGAGDTVGCGLHLRSREVFFTLNGMYLGPAFVLTRLALRTPLILRPTVGVDSRQKVSLNFGLSGPFRFDISGDHPVPCGGRMMTTGTQMWKEAVPCVDHHVVLPGGQVQEAADHGTRLARSEVADAQPPVAFRYATFVMDHVGVEQYFEEVEEDGDEDEDVEDEDDEDEDDEDEDDEARRRRRRRRLRQRRRRRRRQ